MNNGRVLLIHRHAGTRASLKKGLEQNGYMVIMAFSGSSAVNILKLEDIQAAFVDLRSAECASLELVHRLQHVRPDLPLFGLADTPSKFEIDACRKIGIQGYFIAPFNVTALVNAIASIEMTSPEVEDRAAI